MLNTEVLYEVFTINFSALLTLSVFVWLIFYILPQKIFPQEHIKNLPDKIMFNVLYMLSYVLLVVPILLQMKIYSLPIFIFSIVLTKLLFIKFYHKQLIRKYIYDTRIEIYSKLLDIVEFKDELYWKKREFFKNKINNFFININVEQSLTYFIVFVVFFYSAYTFSIRGLYSFSDGLSDVSQFIEWVAHMEHGDFWSDTKAFGADMYGQPALIFFLKSVSNINSLIVFNVYPFFTVSFLLFSIYYVVSKATTSHYSGLFAVLFFTMILMSPLNYLFTGTMQTTSTPEVFNFFGLSLFSVPEHQVPGMLDHGVWMWSMWRHSTGLAYELASIMFLPNAYFLIKTLETNSNKYLALYATTLFLAFTFHGGFVVFLLPISLAIFANSIIFRKLSWELLKKGIYTILGAAFLGNIWMFAMIKYGLPKDVGAAMPILDEILSTEQHTEDMILEGGVLELVIPTSVQFVMIGLAIVLFIYTLFNKNRFLQNSIIHIVLVTIIIFFAQNLGLPKLVHFQRAATYLFTAFALLGGLVFYFIIHNLVHYFAKNSYEQKMRYIFAILIFLSLFATPKWHSKDEFWENISKIEYAEFPFIIYKVEKEHQPLSWTIVADNQTYAKVVGKGFHVGTSDFLLNYDPSQEELKIPTKTIFIFHEHIAHTYKGGGEWWLRWRNDMSRGIKKWITTYHLTHDNLETWYNGKDITVYKIDNSAYMKKLNDEEIAKRKREKMEKRLKKVEK